MQDLVGRASTVDVPSAAARGPASIWRARLASPWGVGIWAVLVAAGMGLLIGHSKTSGAASAIARWPNGTRLTLDGRRPTLVMFAHPKCPCTRASLAELSRIMGECPGAIAGRVVFVRPPGADPQWERTDLWTAATAIPGMSVTVDGGGAEAARFGAVTSGQVLLFGTDGMRLFAGGITGSRGHEGANDGHDAVCAIVHQSAAAAGSTPVFGCPLCNAQESKP